MPAPFFVFLWGKARFSLPCRRALGVTPYKSRYFRTLRSCFCFLRYSRIKMIYTIISSRITPMMMRNQGLVSTEPLWLIKDSISLRDTLYAATSGTVAMTSPA